MKYVSAEQNYKHLYSLQKNVIILLIYIAFSGRETTCILWDCVGYSM